MIRVEPSRGCGGVSAPEDWATACAQKQPAKTSDAASMRIVVCGGSVVLLMQDWRILAEVRPSACRLVQIRGKLAENRGPDNFLLRAPRQAGVATGTGRRNG